MRSSPTSFAISTDFFQQHLSEIHYRNFIHCPATLPVVEVAKSMRQHRQSAVLIEDSKGSFQGIFTDKDLRNRVVAEGRSLETPVFEVMSQPLATIGYRETIFEALLRMNQRGMMHLAVVNDSNQVIGLVRYHRLIGKGFSPFYLVQEIEKTTSVTRLTELHRMIPAVVTALLEGKTPVRKVSGLISLFADSVAEQLLQRALEEEEFGPAPVPFVFLGMGSEGRQEQTLKTDQDNAIVFADVPDSELEATQQYFLRLGEWVCSRLDQIGYDYCKGNVMAQNPQWCQPLSKWRDYFRHWVLTPEPQAVLEASIFFDFRPIFGDPRIAEQLRLHLQELLHERQAKLFLLHMARNAGNMPVPLNWLGKLSLERRGPHAQTFDLKKAMTPIVDYARLLCLEQRNDANSTMDRLDWLLGQELLSSEEYSEVMEAYVFLLRLRLSHQIQRIRQGESPENHLNPKECTPLDQKLIVETLQIAKSCQSRLRSRFAPMDR